jgi:hypothetical protein
MTTEDIYIETLKKLTEFTRIGKIKWKRQNLSTLYLEQFAVNGQMAVLSLQRITISGVYYYIFTIKNTSRNEISLNIDTTKEYNYQLFVADLYSAALLSVENDSLNFLSDLMDSFQ